MFKLSIQIIKEGEGKGMIGAFILDEENSLSILRKDIKDDKQVKSFYESFELRNDASIQNVQDLILKVGQLGAQHVYFQIKLDDLSNKSIILLDTTKENQVISYASRTMFITPIRADISYTYLQQNGSQIKRSAHSNLFFFALKVNQTVHQQFKLHLQTTYRTITYSVGGGVLLLMVGIIILFGIKLRQIIISFHESIDWTIELLNIISKNNDILDTHLDETIIKTFFKQYCLNSEARVLLETYFTLILKLISTANQFFFEGQEQMALQSYMNAEQLYKQLGNKCGIGICNHNIGNIYFRQRKYEEAYQLYLNSYNIVVSEKENLSQSENLDTEEVRTLNLTIAKRALSVAQSLKNISQLPVNQQLLVKEEDIQGKVTLKKENLTQKASKHSFMRKKSASQQIEKTGEVIQGNGITGNNKKILFQKIQENKIVDLCDTNIERTTKDETLQRERSQSMFQSLPKKDMRIDLAIDYYQVAYSYLCTERTKSSISCFVYICISMAECFVHLGKYSSAVGLIEEAKKKLENCIQLIPNFCKLNAQDETMLKESKSPPLPPLELCEIRQQAASFHFTLGSQAFASSKGESQDNNLNQKVNKTSNKFRESFMELYSPYYLKLAFQSNSQIKPIKKNSSSAKFSSEFASPKHKIENQTPLNSSFSPHGGIESFQSTFSKGVQAINNQFNLMSLNDSGSQEKKSDFECPQIKIEVPIIDKLILDIPKSPNIKERKMFQPLLEDIQTPNFTIFSLQDEEYKKNQSPNTLESAIRTLKTMTEEESKNLCDNKSPKSNYSNSKSFKSHFFPTAKFIGSNSDVLSMSKIASNWEKLDSLKEKQEDNSSTQAQQQTKNNKQISKLNIDNDKSLFVHASKKESECQDTPNLPCPPQLKYKKLTQKQNQAKKHPYLQKNFQRKLNKDQSILLSSFPDTINQQMNNFKKEELFLPYCILHMKLKLVEGKLNLSKGDNHYLEAAKFFVEVLEYKEHESEDNFYDPLDKIEAMEKLYLIFQHLNYKNEANEILQEVTKVKKTSEANKQIHKPLFFIDSFV